MTAAPSAQALHPDAARRRRGMARWRARSTMIHVFRVLLPVVILAILAALGGWVLYKSTVGRPVEAPSGPVALRMLTPLFYGRNTSGQPYVMGARAAVRDEHDLQRIALDHPTMNMNINAPNQTRITADHGIYREDDKIMHLDTNVVFVHADGTTFKTEKATVDTNTGIITGDAPIAGDGPRGQIQGDTYTVYDKGDRIIFRGNVHGVIKRD